MEKTSEGIINSSTVNELAEVLRTKGYRVVIINDDEKIVEYIHQIPNDVVIGLGDSITTCTLRIRNILARKGTLIYYGWNGDPNYNRSIETFENHPLPEYFLTRINYITLKGEMLLKDYSRASFLANRFPDKIIAFAGYNRIINEFDDNPALQKYTVLRHKPENVDVTIVLLPGMAY